MVTVEKKRKCRTRSLCLPNHLPPTSTSDVCKCTVFTLIKHQASFSGPLLKHDVHAILLDSEAGMANAMDHLH